jgi:hypothetical protein
MSAKRLTVLATLVTLTAVLLAAPAAAHADSTESSGTTIVYSPTYLKYIALFPEGYAPNACYLSLTLSGSSGACGDIWSPVWFYPDGTTGERPWLVDPSSATGWSIVRDPCAEADEDWYADEWWPLYVAYLEWFIGWTDARPEGITDFEGGCLIAIYGF